MGSAAVDTRQWGLDRTNQRQLPLDGDVTYDTSGAGVDVYVIDSGINADHEDFGGRVVGGFNASDASDPTGWKDCHGHGTHVAGTAAGSTWGVATAANLYAVKVFDDCVGRGSIGSFVAGVDWTMSVADGPSVANMSLGGPASSFPVIKEVTENLINSSMSVVAAAGNSAIAACLETPANVPGALTIAAFDIADRQAGFSNFGACVDVYAPGVDIWSASAFSNADAVPNSGTSMSAPHVAGAVALYLGENQGASPSQVHDAIVVSATSGVLSGVASETPNKLLFTGGRSTEGGVVTVRASGSTGEETVALEVNGTQVARFNLSTQLA